MSRTDKDMPLWVQATHWVPEHYACEHARWRRGRRECDLPEKPSRSQKGHEGGRTWYRFPVGITRATPQCIWAPDINRMYRERTNHFAAPPKWFIDHVGHNMERRRKREECIAARKEYRATGEVDIVPTVLQHRHQAIWLYW